MDDLLQAILAKLDRGDSPDSKWPDHKGEYWARCPFHTDAHATNFSVSERGFRCFVCGSKGGLLALAEKIGAPVARWRDAATDKSTFYSLAQYAQDKQLPEGFLRSLGLTDRKYGGSAAVRIPYRDAAGMEVAARYRIAATGEDKFRWQKGIKAQPYGLDRLNRSAEYVVIVEGESDAQTLWLRNVPAVGIPGASMWKTEWAQYFTGLTVYVWQEPDQGGAQFVAKIGASLPDCRIITPPPGRKDISACHLAGDDVPSLLAQLMTAARPYRDISSQQASQDAAEAKRIAGDLLLTPNLLSVFSEVCKAQGLVGEERTTKLLYLALTSRLLDRPVSVVVKGPSSGGKSFTVDTVLRGFPSAAYHALSSMSERSLAYSTEPLSHRFLVLYEAAGMAGEMATYLMRTLLSEGCIRYETVEKTADGLKNKLIERPGPTGLIVTTTAASLHPENETRMFSVTVKDTVQQTTGVLHALADQANGKEPTLLNLAPWHALQTWLDLAGSRDVTIPYAHQLADLADPRAVRLRRDFGAILNLIRSHAILHQEQRGRDLHGRIVATLDDYAAVYDLVAELVSEGVAASVSTETRETVAAVAALVESTRLPVSYTQVGAHLKLDDSAARRRCQVAISGGYLINTQDKRGQPAKLLLGGPLPAGVYVIPTPEKLMCVLSSPTTVPPCHRSPDAPDEPQPGGTQGETSHTGGDLEANDLAEWQKSLLAEYETGSADPSY